jgi:hypothetical protein
MLLRSGGRPCGESWSPRKKQRKEKVHRRDVEKMEIQLVLATFPGTPNAMYSRVGRVRSYVSDVRPSVRSEESRCLLYVFVLSLLRRRSKSWLSGPMIMFVERATETRELR